MLKKFVTEEMFFDLSLMNELVVLAANMLNFWIP